LLELSVQVVVKNTLINYGVVNPKVKKVCLVLHGWGHRGEMWRGVVERMPTNYKYVLVDLPGFGGSGYLEGENGVVEYSQLVKNLCKKLRFEKVAIMGHSFGGQIGADLAIKEPKLIGKLILVAPAIVRKKSLVIKIKRELASRLGLIKKVFPEVWVKNIFRLVASKDYWQANEKQKKIFKSIVDYNLEKDISKIKCPCLIVWGDKDSETPFEGKKVCEKIKNSYLKVIYGGGHNLHLTRTSDLAEIAGRWLDD